MDPVLARSLSLAGPGRAGRAFLRSWVQAGGRARQVIVRASGADSGEGFPDAVTRAISQDSFDATDLLVLAVPDDAIAGCAARLAGRLRCRFAFHLSGALPADALAPLRSAGASVASMHPLRPYTGAPEEDWRGAFVAVEGDAAAVEEGERIARALDAQPHRLATGSKPLYHAAASMAAGGTVAVLAVAVRACAAAGIPEAVARAALAKLASEATAAAASSSFERALTGAVASRDFGTVRAHARALAPFGDALALYRALAEEILAHTAGRGGEQEIRAILRSPDSPPEADGRNPL
ncbi:MAG: DUF2520 domain-containing protein [Acidobacteriota bacterium]